MSKKLKIWLLIIAILLVLIGWVVHKQWNNISAVVDALRYSNEEVENKLQENTREIHKYLEENENITVREMTEEEARALSEGTLTEEEVIQRMIGTTSSGTTETEEPPTGPPFATEGTPSTNPPVTEKPINEPDAPVEKTTGQTVAEAVAKLYITKSDYLGRLDSIEAQVRAAYIALPAAEKKGAKQRFLSQYLPMVASWEAECDAAVYAVIDQIRTALKESGQGEAVADQIESSYLNEKRLKKSYFINRYMD